MILPGTRSRAVMVGSILSGPRSGHVRPRLAVDGRAGGHVADAEFGGKLPVGHAVRPPGPQLPYLPGGQLGPGVTLTGAAVIGAVAFPAPRLESYPDVIAGGIDRRPVLRGLRSEEHT